MTVPVEVEGEAPAGGLWSYLRQREIDVYPSGRLRWLLLGIVVLGWSVEQFESLKLGPVLVYMLDEFDVTIREWGRVLALAGVFYGIGSFTLSRLADRFGRRPLLIWPVALYAVMSAAAALAPSFFVLALLTLGGSLLIAGMSPAVHAASRDVTPRMGRALAYSWVSLAFTLGALLSSFVAARTLPIWPGWRPMCWIAAGLAVLTAAVVAIFYRDLSPRVRGQIVERLASGMLSSIPSARHVGPRSGPDTPDTLLAQEPSPGLLDSQTAGPRPDGYYTGELIYRSPRLWILGTTLLFWSLAYVTVASYVPTFLTQHFHVEPARAATVTTFFWLVFTASVFVSGWLSDRLCVRKTVTAFGGIATGLCYMVGANLPLDTPFVHLVFIWSLTGCCAGFIYPAWCAVFSETAEQVTPFGVARAFGFVGLQWPLAGIALNLGLPQVVARWGWPAWMMIAGASCWMCALLVVFGKGPWWVPKAKRLAVREGEASA